MRLLFWVLRAFIFFTLFAFALNNQQRVTVRWFFGAESTAPMVLVVLGAFALGCVVGVVAMLPGGAAPSVPKEEPGNRRDRRKKGSPAGA